jgi:hypothetical protein
MADNKLKGRSEMKRMFIVVFALIACFGSAALAQVPALLSYQGVLTDAGGAAVADGKYRITFSIYDVEKNGSALWTEDDSVTVTRGIFNAILGSKTLLTGLPFDTSYYLGIAVEGGSELVPRALITASAYSLNAQAVKGWANVFPANGDVGIGTTSPSVPLHVKNTSGQVGIFFEGNDDYWASIYVNAIKATASATYGYERQGLLKATTYVDPGDIWNLEIGGDNRIRVSPAGGVCVGSSTPTEKLQVDGGILLGNSSNTNAGTMRWSGTDFEGYDGSSWKSFTATGGGSLPSGTMNQTLRHNGVDWVATGNLYNDGSKIGIGTTGPMTDLHIRRDADATVGIEIENRDPGANSTQRIDFADENGTLAGLTIFDNDNAAYPSQMRLFNNRPSGSLHLIAGSGSLAIESGNVGVDVPSPNATLHVKGGNWDLDATEGDLKIGDDTNRLKFSIATGGAGEGIGRMRAVGTANTLMLGAGTSDVLSLDATGVAKLGVLGSTGQLDLYRAGVTNRVLTAYTNAYGGNLDLYDESNTRTAMLEADVNGTGGYLGIYRTAGALGFTVDGNGLGVQEPIVTITGSSKSVAFDMDQSGTSTVVLPTGSITATETGDEPGVVAYTEGLATITLGSTISTIGSQTITAPAAGYVLVIATGQYEITHTNGTNTDATVGVSMSSTTLPGNQDIRILLPGTVPSGLYAFPVTAHAVFSVSAGPNTFYFLGREDSGDVRLYDIQLSCLYIATAYGTVEPPAASAGASDDAAAPPRPAIDVAAQRATSEAADNARVERELAAMRAELEAVKARLENK